jgi:hypothetical protein
MAKRLQVPQRQQEYRDEAARLAKLPKAEQRQIIAWHKDIAADPKAKTADRQAAGDRALALERLLGLAGKVKKRQ